MAKTSKPVDDRERCAEWVASRGRKCVRRALKGLAYCMQHEKKIAKRWAQRERWER